jgi:hypothetical protein
MNTNLFELALSADPVVQVEACKAIFALRKDGVSCSTPPAGWAEKMAASSVQEARLLSLHFIGPESPAWFNLIDHGDRKTRTTAALMLPLTSSLWDELMKRHRGDVRWANFCYRGSADGLTSLRMSRWTKEMRERRWA